MQEGLTRCQEDLLEAHDALLTELSRMQELIEGGKGANEIREILEGERHRDPTPTPSIDLWYGSHPTPEQINFAEQLGEQNLRRDIFELEPLPNKNNT